MFLVLKVYQFVKYLEIRKKVFNHAYIISYHNKVSQDLKMKTTTEIHPHKNRINLPWQNI